MNFWTYISNLGLTTKDSSDVVRKYQLINRICCLAAIVTLFFVPHLYLIGHYSYTFIQLVTGLLVMLVCYIFSKNRRYYFSYYSMFLFILINVFFCSLEVPDAGVEYFLIPLGFGTLLIVDKKNEYIGLIVLSAATLFLVYLLKDSYKPDYIVSHNATKITYIITLTANFFICSAFVYQFRELNTKHEKIITEQKADLQIKNKEITDSINYAQRIQQAKLPRIEEFYSVFPNSFILFKPKDIVSGDFYYFHQINETLFVASADCTGHGIPGALMSMIGLERLEDALTHSTDTSIVLSHLNKGIKNSLRQTDEKSSTRDGMDIALCSINTYNGTLCYAGANRPLWIIRNGLKTVEEIKATKAAIGGLTEDHQYFEKHELQLQHGDSFYIFSDGYADTFGGQSKKKLTTKKFKEILVSIQDKSMHEQKTYLNSFIEEWKSGEEQIDDILVIGIRL